MSATSEISLEEKLAAADALLARATCFDFGDDIFVSRRGDRWALTNSWGETFSCDGEWVREPSASNRTA